MALRDTEILDRLKPPAGRVDLVLDTDTFNEIDDQFALVHAALATERITLHAVHAAPFQNERSSGPAEGMEKSHTEILRLLELLDLPAAGLVHRGSTRFMGADRQPEASASTENLLRLARALPPGRPLYVAAIGAITNVASALLLHPELADRIVVVWLGGHPAYCGDQMEFNLRQDPHAVNAVLDSRVPFIRVPCAHVAEALRSTEAEMARLCAGQGRVGDALYRLFADYVGNAPGRSKVLWDLAVTAWLVDASHFESEVIPAPHLQTEAPLAWQPGPGRHPVRVCTRLNRDRVFQDLAARLAARAAR